MASQVAPQPDAAYLNQFCTRDCLDGHLCCRCGETGFYDWLWQSASDDSIRLSSNRREILFHPVYSDGTAALKGMKPLARNMHHYWEMKMTSNIYGTDVMIGVGTKDLFMFDWRKQYFSLLGCDNKSWGYSYNGQVQHEGVTVDYGAKYGIGSLIGLHLDMYRGTLEYYYNRRPLGVAFSGLKAHELYPMVCSTAAQSSMKLTCSMSIDETLQFQCLKAIVNNRNLLERYKSLPWLKRIFEKRFFWMLEKGEKKNLIY